ncbi:hypothetical protein IFR05_014538 [Cadophora sp. M221]|nr:hypothetical protein IFR05_014538 [Cadophora sp. M221]
MAWGDDRREWELPHLKEAHQMPVLNDGSQKGADLKPVSSADFWSVKFYPHTEPGVDPVFAVVGGKRILICRPTSGKDNAKLDIIGEIIDEDNETEDFACAWTKDPETGTPLLCVSGNSRQLKVYNGVTGQLLRTLSGHGGEINDLAVSPINPCIIASASEDCTVRIWSLDPRHARQPCAAILEGDGHEESVLCLWTLPEFPDANTSTNIPTRIYYPHFSTSEIHSDMVDCVAWYGDQILSKALNEHTIVLWSITNFNSKLPPPPHSSAPTTHSTSHRPSRSAFVAPPPSAADNAITLLTRLFELSIPESHIMFTRFSLFPGHKKSELGRNPVVAFCNTNSKVFFFDLARLENYWDIAWELPGPDGRRVGDDSSFATPSHLNSVARPEPGHGSAAGSGSKEAEPDKDQDLKSKTIPTDQAPRAHPFLHPFQRRNRGGGNTGAGALARLARETSLSESTGSEHTNQDEPSQAQSSSHNSNHNAAANTNPNSKGKIDWARSREGWSAKYEMGDPQRKLEAHHTEMVKGIKFVGRQVAWSNDGMWCVVVGSGGSIGVLARWGR